MIGGSDIKGDLSHFLRVHVSRPINTVGAKSVLTYPLIPLIENHALLLGSITAVVLKISVRFNVVNHCLARTFSWLSPWAGNFGDN